MTTTIQDRYVSIHSSEDFPALCEKPDRIVFLNVPDETVINVCESRINAEGRPEVTLTMRELWTLLETYQATRQETTPHEGV